ncbi:MAG TPA: hydroxymethylbilane synthase [Candidatus Baltobacteraceae bacterium]|nr:hydroxymethylbilane synthase [Candidatus Baltobacteraceae bacterium]
MTRLRIGTRGSSLALWQANHIADSLAKLHGVETDLVRIRTSGDRLQSASVIQVNEAIGAEGGKGIFIKEIEDALLSGAVDLAVHSMKDVPTETPAGLAFAAITRREDPRDCLISRERLTLERLPQGARVGTSSLRRQAQLRHHRSDLDVVDLRGNVDTRIRKLDSGEFDAIVLALAGVTRLGTRDKVAQIFDEDLMLPAVGQGALGIETRADDAQTSGFVAALDDSETRACITAERALLRELQGGCQVPLGAWGRIRKGELHLEAAVFSAAGSESVRFDEAGSPAEAEAIGIRLAQTLIEAGADKILRLAGRSVGRS